MRLNSAQKICLAFYIILVIFWLVIFSGGVKDGFNNYLYSFLFGLIPFFGGIAAMFSSKTWGGFGSAVGKGVFFVGLGLFLWGTGESIWSYYNFFLNEAAPYPSWADLGFGPSIFFYSLGAFYLSKATGAKYALKSVTAKVLVVLTTVILLLLSHYVLIIKARNTTLSDLVIGHDDLLKIVLDVAYPFGGFIGLLLAVLISGLSFKYLGGKYKYDIYAILIGLALMFIGDYTFSYATTVGTYYNANFGDLILATGLFFLTFGILGFTGFKETHAAENSPS